MYTAQVDEWVPPKSSSIHLLAAPSPSKEDFRYLDQSHSDPNNFGRTMYP